MPRKTSIESFKDSILEIDGYLYRSRQTTSGNRLPPMQLTSFAIYPIEAINIPGEGEALRAQIISKNEVKNVLFPQNCWCSAMRFKTCLPSREFVFTGGDEDVQLLRYYLASETIIQRTGLQVAGIHYDEENKRRFVVEEGSLSVTGKIDADIFYYGEPEGRGKPNVQSRCRLLNYAISMQEELQSISELITKFNTPVASLPILGWTVATFFKPMITNVLEKMGLGNGFPILNIGGEAGSGKTSTIKNVIMKIWAMDGDPKAVAATKQFTLMATVNSSNCIPVILEENKSCTQTDSLKNVISDLIRSSYNSLEGDRGKPSLAVKVFKYQAPLIIVGETLFDEAAILDRLIPVLLSKRDSSPHRESFKQLSKLPLEKLGRALLARALAITDSEIQLILEKELLDISPNLEDRPRVNTAIARFGLCILEDMLEIQFGDKCMVDASVCEGVLESEPGNRKSAIDKILEVMSLMSEDAEAPLNGDPVRDFDEGIRYKTDFMVAGDELRLRLRTAYPKFRRWAHTYKYEGEVLSEATVKKLLKKEPYFISSGSSYIGIRQQSCYLLSVSEMKKKGLNLSYRWDNNQTIEKGK